MQKEPEPISVETGGIRKFKKPAIEFFHANHFEEDIYSFWLNLNLIDFQNCCDIARYISIGDEKEWPTILGTNPLINNVRPRLAKLCGPVFEYQAHSFLNIRNQITSRKFLEINRSFDQVLSAFAESKKLELAGRDGNAQGVSIKWQGRSVTVPDGFIIEEHGNVSVILAVYESTLRPGMGAPESEWLFIEFLRDNPAVTQKIFQAITPHQTISITDDRNFQFHFVHRRDLPLENAEKMRKEGWITVRTPFDYFDSSREAMLILKNPPLR